MGAGFSSGFGASASVPIEGDSGHILAQSKSGMEARDPGKSSVTAKTKSKSTVDSTLPKPTKSLMRAPQEEQKPMAKPEEKPTKVENRNSSEQKNKAKKTKDPPLVVQARKRSERRDSLSWTDPLSQKDRHRLSSNDAIVHTNSAKFLYEMLKVHNSYRADHGVSSLKMSVRLNKEAKERADAYLLGTIQKEHHMPCSENTFCTSFHDGFKSVPSAIQVCSEWYEYALNFDYNLQKKFPSKSVKFMQMIWASEKEMGACRATNGAGRTVVVALYSPKAEMPFEIRKNVRPSLVELDPNTFQHEFTDESKPKTIKPIIAKKRT